MSKQQILKNMNKKDYIEPNLGKLDQSNPFKTPDGYFESFEDRLMGRIEMASSPEQKPGRVIRMLKPILSIAASITLFVMLVQYPVRHYLLNETVVTEQGETVNTDSFDLYSVSLTMVDENTLMGALFAEEQAVEEDINPDEMLSYLSSRLTEAEIYSMFQN